MKALPLEAKKREVSGKKVKKLRNTGEIPATVYGKDVKSQSLMVNLKDFFKVYATAGETGLVDLKIDKNSLPTLIADVQLHPVSHQILHVQFHAVKLTEKIKAHVPVEIVGDSPKVTSGEGLLLETLQEIEVLALPTDLPEKISVDVSGLLEIGQQITVGELPKVSGVEVLTEASEIVVKLDPAISEAAKKEAEEAAAKAAAEQAAEGAAPTEAAAAEPTDGGEKPTSESEQKGEAS
jgi:large subunit ribosomal protein L25